MITSLGIPVMLQKIRRSAKDCIGVQRMLAVCRTDCIGVQRMLALCRAVAEMLTIPLYVPLVCMALTFTLHTCN